MNTFIKITSDIWVDPLKINSIKIIYSNLKCVYVIRVITNSKDIMDVGKFRELKYAQEHMKYLNSYVNLMVKTCS